MEEIVRGLNYLGPTLEQMARQIELLNIQSAELKAALAQKADAAELSQFRQQLATYQSGAAKSTKAEADRGEIQKKLTDQVLTVVAEVAKKADLMRLERLEVQLEAVLKDCRSRAQGEAVTLLEQQVQSVTASMSQKVDRGKIDSLNQDLQALKEALTLKAESSDLERLGLDLGGIVASKADANIVDQLIAKDRSLSAALTQKAEFAELEQLKIQFHALSGTASQRSEGQAQEVELLSSKLQALTATFARLGVEELRGRVEDLDSKVTLKAEGTKVDELISQIQVLSDLLGPQIRRIGSPRPRSARGTPKHAHTTA